MKQSHAKSKKHYEPIHLPKNSSLGFFVGVLSFFFSFGIIWYMWWMTLLSLIGIIGCLIVRLSNRSLDLLLSSKEIEKMEASS